MAGNYPTPTGKSECQPSVKDQTSALIPTPRPSPTGIEYVKGKGVSFELADAPYMCIPTSLKKISEDEMRVLAWLRVHKAEIVAAESEFFIDRRAIAAAIGWEATVNVINRSWRGVGPAKNHVWNWKWQNGGLLIGDTMTWAKRVEDYGLLPPSTYEERVKVIRTPAGAIRYTAAAMSLIANIYEKADSPGICDPPIRLNPWILVNEYQGSDAEKWSTRMKTIKPGERLTLGTVRNPDKYMGDWLADCRNLRFIEDAVGLPEIQVAGPKNACEPISAPDDTCGP